MSEAARFHDAPAPNPIDVIETLASENDWPFERSGDSDLSLSVSGTWCDVQLEFTMAGARDVLLLDACFEFRVPAPRRVEAALLAAMVNQRVWLGHFGLSTEDGQVGFRLGIPLADGAHASAAQCEQMIAMALDACERFYPAFQFVIWGGKTAVEAVNALILDCQGEA